MIYRELGRTGLQVSQLGFGAMRLPMIGEGEEQRVNRELAIPMIQRAFDGGVNYIDSAVGYCNQDSQRCVGEALQGYRERIIVSTKNPYYEEDETIWWTNLENSLERLRIQSIDIYNHHGLNWKAYTEHVEPRMARWMQKAKDQGLIKRICCSFHDNNDALMKIVDTGYVESITLQYNLLDRQLEEGIAHAHAKGVGIVVMGPVGGGRLGVDNPALAEMVPGIARIPELALRFVLSNPNVSLALSGMSTVEQVEENLRITSSPATLSADDLAAIEEHMARLKQMADLYCSGCKYCQPCPQGVNIPGIFQWYNQGRVYGFWQNARNAYAWHLNNPKEDNMMASACVECGECETKCPQHLPIIKQLAECHEALKPEG